MLGRSYKIVDTKRFEIFIEDVVQESEHALVRIDYCAICKADIRYYLGKRDKKILDLKYPLSLIHEAVGTVLKDNSGRFKTGDIVVLVPNIVKKCADCHCEREDLTENYCPNALFASSNYDGFSKEVISFPSSNLVKINSSESYYVFCELISVAIAALRRVEVDNNSKVAVFGDGILGYILCAVIQAVYDCDISIVGRHSDKLDMFSMCDNRCLADEVKNASVGFDTGFECVGGAGSESAINSMIDLITIGGKIVLTGVSEENIPINTRKILEKGISITGSTRSSVSDFEMAVKLLENESFTKHIEALVIGEAFINNIDDYYFAFENEIKNRELGKNILVF